ncbi:protein GVQW3-like [Nylanderia fulva]|uniref:protein GVQW3-like n=1 Tax=Nylanderia fulva TaxID=613905 RepID=UPI0010FB4FC4|nr:protein GVQW3-like [Nylanderia fulva]
MERTLEQRYAIKFCVKLQKTAKETFDFIRPQTFKNDCLSYSQVKKWHKSFKESREEVADEARSGRPSTSRTDDNVTRVRDLLNKDRRMSVRLMSEQLNLPKTDVHRIVSEDLAMRKICAKLVPKVLSDAQKQQRMEATAPYSPDVAPADFFLFPRVKRELKGKHLETLDNIQNTTTRCFNSIPKSEFQMAYDAWKTRWQRCIDAEGDYFEEY